MDEKVLPAAGREHPPHISRVVVPLLIATPRNWLPTPLPPPLSLN
jgi:hypothetical protein